MMSQATTAIVANPTNTIVDLCRRGIGAMLSMQAGLRVALMGRVASSLQGKRLREALGDQDRVEFGAESDVPGRLMTLLSCRQDVRVGGGYRLEISHPKMPTPLAFFGKYLEVVPNARLVWSNEESDDGAVTTVTVEERDGKTLLVMSELYSSKQALENAFEGREEAMPETFGQLDEFLVARGAGAQRT
jgi:uncharacterized protein YndB with AHSA1/START domain